MVLQSSGVLSVSNIQTEFGGTNPISISEYYKNNSSGYTSGVTGIPNTGSPLTLSIFYGKSKTQTLKTVTLTTGTFDAWGVYGGWSNYSSPAITIPSDLVTLVSWDLTFYAYKNNTGFGGLYVNIGINGVGGTYVSDIPWQPGSISRSWNNQTISLGSASTSRTCYIGFLAQTGLTSCYFTLTIRYY